MPAAEAKPMPSTRTLPLFVSIEAGDADLHGAHRGLGSTLPPEPLLASRLTSSVPDDDWIVPATMTLLAARGERGRTAAGLIDVVPPWRR